MHSYEYTSSLVDKPLPICCIASCDHLIKIEVSIWWQFWKLSFVVLYSSHAMPKFKWICNYTLFYCTWLLYCITHMLANQKVMFLYIVTQLYLLEYRNHWRLHSLSTYCQHIMLKVKKLIWNQLVRVLSCNSTSLLYMAYVKYLAYMHA